MTFDDAGLLLEIARCGSLAGAARQRGIDPSSVSRIVTAIEAELGFRVFQRTTRHLTLTEAGDIYLRRVSTVRDAFDQARDEALSIANGPSGTLRMTAAVSFAQHVLVPLLPRFRAACPGVRIELISDDTNLDLVAEGIDLAIRLAANIHGDVVVAKLQSTRYRVCASPDYLLRHGSPSIPQELAERDCLRFSLPGYRSRWLFRDAAGETCEVAVTGGVLASGALALHALALAGVGPALLANWLSDDDIKTGRLVDLFPDWRVTATTLETGVWLVYPKRAYLPQKVRAMIDFLRAESTAVWSRWR